MSTRWVLLAALALTGVAHAEEAADAEVEAEAPRWEAELQLRYGRASVTLAPESGPPEAMRTESLTTMLVVGHEFDERFSVELLVPFVLGRLAPEGEPAAAAPPAFGNLGVEAAFRFQPRGDVLLRPLLQLSLPTARGEEGGSAEDVTRFVLLRGAGFAQGSQQAALFEAGRLGTELGLDARWTPGRLLVRGWLKLEAMFDVRGAAREDVIIESVGGAVVGYRLGAGFTASLGFSYARPWTTHASKRFEAGTLDPAIEWSRGVGRLVLAAVLPLFGSSTVEKTYGLSLSGALRF